MVVASIVLGIINVGALLALVWVILQARDDLVLVIHDTMETEVRRQDDRLEKRRQRAPESPEDTNGTEPGQAPAVQAGRPMRS